MSVASSSRLVMGASDTPQHTTLPEPHPTELLVIKQELGARACEIPINSIKAIAIGAAGAVEAISTIHTLRTWIVPPTIICVEQFVRFGGHNGVLASCGVPTLS